MSANPKPILDAATTITTTTTTTSTTTTTPPPPPVHGIATTPLSQCTHWHSPLDIIAIKHVCCGKFYACISCHDGLEDHVSGVWPRGSRGERAVLCGGCKYVASIEEYMGCGSVCVRCGRGFNPGCEGHWGRYFEV